MSFGSEKHSIGQIENFGEILVLDNNSRWKVAMTDKTKSMMWMILDDVTVEGQSPMVKITHIKRKETISVTRLPG